MKDVKRENGVRGFNRVLNLIMLLAAAWCVPATTLAANTGNNATAAPGANASANTSANSKNATVPMASTQCEGLNLYAADNGKVITGNTSAYTVSGKDRLYFYFGPNDECLNKRVFIVPGDRVTAYREWKGFYSITYYNKAGGMFEGWVKSDRLSQ
ncbi:MULTISPECIES: hypothetical protein [Dickeya]|uniref:hypothetical protein n=1 Tax=Dickeya TaxID=204037 RepID=UPI00119DE6F1|nr:MULTISPECIES: hypothetical protein [Dickeya]